MGEDECQGDSVWRSRSRLIVGGGIFFEETAGVVLIGGGIEVGDDEMVAASGGGGEEGIDEPVFGHCGNDWAGGVDLLLDGCMQDCTRNGVQEVEMKGGGFCVGGDDEEEMRVDVLVHD